MHTTASEVLTFVQENDVKFIRLAFCNLFGRQKNISIMPQELPRAFTEGIAFDASAVAGFTDVAHSDLFLQPDAGTLAVLPWRPAHGRVARLFCNVTYPDGAPFEGDGRHILAQAVQRAASMGYAVKIGAACAFYLFELDEAGQPTMTPQDEAGYGDIAPLDKGENVRREICLTMEEMGIAPESSHHAQGPGQNEIDFTYADACSAADQLVTSWAVVKTIAARNGLHASFLPKPFADKSGSGMHINLSLAKEGQNIFRIGDEHSPEAESFIAGILARAREMTAFLNPLTNSYARLGAFEAPRYVTWSHQNRSQLIRIPAARSQKSVRMELRSADPTLNPYLGFALLIHAGLDGIAQRMPLHPSTDFDLFCADAARLAGLEQLPTTLKEAVEAAEASGFLKTYLPARTLDQYLAAKRAQWDAVTASDNPALKERSLYFPRV